MLPHVGMGTESSKWWGLFSKKSEWRWIAFSGGNTGDIYLQVDAPSAFGGKWLGAWENPLSMSFVGDDILTTHFP